MHVYTFVCNSYSHQKTMLFENMRSLDTCRFWHASPLLCRNIAVGEAAAHDPRKKNLLNLRSNVLKSNLSIYIAEKIQTLATPVYIQNSSNNLYGIERDSLHHLSICYSARCWTSSANCSRWCWPRGLESQEWCCRSPCRDIVLGLYSALLFVECPLWNWTADSLAFRFYLGNPHQSQT